MAIWKPQCVAQVSSVTNFMIRLQEIKNGESVSFSHWSKQGNEEPRTQEIKVRRILPNFNEIETLEQKLFDTCN